MARHSVFADRGAEIIELYPTVEVTDRRGTKTLVPSPTPIIRRASVSIARSDVSETAAVAVKVLRLVIRDLPPTTNSWARIRFRGEDWDMDTPPSPSGFSRASRHWELTIRSRNGVQ